ncbi:hypothetical protein [Streptomyces tremellae]|uniref:Uncharacterized protein n=1 Tax=Streptomyces tremellae TaxID=1124239 RepID=A0ABP7F2P4_9ACTN
MVGIDPAKGHRLHRALDPFFTAVDTRTVEYTAPLSPPEALDLLHMTPSAHHLPPDHIGPGSPLPRRTTVSVLATAYRPRRD